MASSSMGARETTLSLQNAKQRSKLQQQIVFFLLAVSLLPLAFTGGGSWFVFHQLFEAKTLELHRSVIERQAATLELYITERTRALELAASSYSQEELQNPEVLGGLFSSLNKTYNNAFLDLGVIDRTGGHVAYCGPHDLSDRDYSGTEWFRIVLSQGYYVSDVFLGYRGIPHVIIAVLSESDDGPWVLRATLDNRQLDQLVHSAALGETGDAFIINREGIYQSPPRQGRILDRSPIEHPALHRGVSLGRVTDPARQQILQATTWLNNSRWVLVVRQNEEEAMAPLSRALTLGVLVVSLAVILMIVSIGLSTHLLTKRLAEADAHRERLSEDLLRSAKLASLGELATGLAHEINNPLAIISVEQTNIGDLIADLPPDDALRSTLEDSLARCRRQVERSAAITSRMLQFGRNEEARPFLADPLPTLKEVVAFMQRRASLQNTTLQLDTDGELPKVIVDPNELEQVLVNLINNSLHAVTRGGTIVVSASATNKSLILIVHDDGVGISQEDLDRVFQPFFTTKPVGEGTGMGLSVCYGIVRNWGGHIDIESEVGRGTTVTMSIPLPSQKRGDSANRR